VRTVESDGGLGVCDVHTQARRTQRAERAQRQRAHEEAETKRRVRHHQAQLSARPGMGTSLCLGGSALAVGRLGLGSNPSSGRARHAEVELAERLPEAAAAQSSVADPDGHAMLDEPFHEERASLFPETFEVHGAIANAAEEDNTRVQTTRTVRGRVSGTVVCRLVFLSWCF
jgi:hypothetical protein